MFGPDWTTSDDNQKAMRKAMNFYGQGDYKSFFRTLGKYGLRIGGMLAGGVPKLIKGDFEGAVRGGREGWGKGRDFSKYSGLGDYNTAVSSNSLISASGIPSSQKSASVNVDDSNLRGDIYITQTEFLQNVTCTIPGGATTSLFEQTKYVINPGLQETFPFLSQLAQNYVMYDMEGCIFQYKPLSGEGASASNNSIGKVIMATQYDPDVDSFYNSIQMENYDYSNSCKPSTGAVHGVETANQFAHISNLYVRSGVSSKDKTQTDVGNFFLATEGIPGAAGTTVTLGELWVTYRVKLSTSNLFGSVLGLNINQDRYTGLVGLNNAFTALTPALVPSTIGTSLSIVGGALHVEFPATINSGTYLICGEFDTAVNAPTTPQATAIANSELKDIFTGTTLIFPMMSAPDSTDSSDLHCCVWCVDIDAPAGLAATVSIALPAPWAGLAGAVSTKIFVTKISTQPLM